MFVRLPDVERRKLLKHPLLGVGYTQVPEYLLTGIFHGAVGAAGSSSACTSAG